MSARYVVRDDGDRAMLVDMRAPHATMGVAPKVLKIVWSTDEAGLERLFDERDRLTRMDDALDDDLEMPCRWRGCTSPAQTRGFCDPHYETL